MNLYAVLSYEVFFEGSRLRLDGDRESMLRELNRRGAVRIRELATQGHSTVSKLVERGLAAVYPADAFPGNGA